MTKSMTKQSSLFVWVGNKSYPVKSLEEASILYRGTVEQFERSTGWNKEVPRSYRNPLIKDADGNIIGYIAYNGNIFAGTPKNWTPQTPRIYDATHYYPESDMRQLNSKGNIKVRRKRRTSREDFPNSILRGLR